MSEPESRVHPGINLSERCELEIVDKVNVSALSRIVRGAEASSDFKNAFCKSIFKI